MEDVKTNTIGKDYSMPDLIKFVAAPVVSKLFISLLSTLDDSLFISRYCGQNALAAFTIALPWFMFMDAVVMVLCVVSAKCSMLMGEHKNDEAKSSFTTMVIISLIVGCFFTIILSLFKIPILKFLGATDILLPYVSEYMNISRFYIPLLICANMFNRFYVIAGKPKVAVFSTIVQIFCNLFFDWLLIVRLGMGIVGAAYGNLVGNILMCLIGVIFYSNSKEEMHFAKPLSNPLPLLKDVWRLGRSQGLTSLSVSVNCFIINYILLKTGGETLVAGYTVVNNVQFMFMNAFFGFNGTVSPLVSYAYGERNAKKLSNIIKKATILTESLAVIVALFIFVFKKPILYLYFANNTDMVVQNMASYGLSVVPFCYAIFSFNILVQEFLIAVGNPKASMFLSALENIVFGNIIAILLPTIFGQNGVWFIFLVVESITLLFTLYVVYINKDVYGYGKEGIASFIER